MKEISEQDEYIPFGEPAHYLQREILVNLKESGKPMAYSELKPIDLDGNGFNHHLKTLVDKGVVAKLEGKRYELTAKGKLGIDYYSLKDSRVKTRPVAGVFMLIISEDNKVLVYKSKGAPKDSHEGLIFGKLRLGQSYHQTIERMLEARGLNDKHQKLSANLNVHYINKGELVAHRSGPLFTVVLSQESSEIKDFGSSTSKISWSDKENLKSDELRIALDLDDLGQVASLDLELGV
jgi:predicted transcriptional regulator